MLPVRKFDKYLIFYRSTPEGLEIVRVVHGAILVLFACIFTLLHGINDDWRPAPLIPITITLNGCWVIHSWPSDIKLIAYAALIPIVCGLTILIAHLKARKDLQGAWGVIGCTLLPFGIGAATVAVRRHLRRNETDGRAETTIR